VTDYCGDGRAVIQANSFPDTKHSSIRRVCLDPENARFEDCQMYDTATVAAKTRHFEEPVDLRKPALRTVDRVYEMEDQG
jgi:hypothetical protein